MQPNQPNTLPEEEFPLHGRKRKPKPSANTTSMMPPVWAIMVTVLLGFLAAGALAFLIVIAGGNRPDTSVKPVVVILSAVPNNTPTISAYAVSATPSTPATATPTPAQSIELSGPTLIPTVTLTPTPVAISIGAQVAVISQGGVNIRSGAGIGNAVIATANIHDMLHIMAGPEVVDGLRWWQVRHIATGSTGWIAENDGQADLIQVYIP